MKIPILSGAYYDISKFDFSLFSIKILNIKSKKFTRYIKSLNPQFVEYNLRFVREIIENNKNNSVDNYAIVSSESIEQFKMSKIYDVWKLLLILFPSDLNIEYELHVSTEEQFSQISSYTTYERKTTGEYPGILLFSSDQNLLEINDYIQNYFCQFSNEGYLRLAIESYITSFYSSHLQHQYLQLMMSLESILEGSNDLSYRLRRSIAVLLGDDTDSCRVIYENLNKLYELRSKIIHGENFNYDAINSYLPCIKSIVSKVIIELLIHGISSRTELNKILNELGYGQKSKISKNWKDYQLNPISDIEAKLIKLKRINPVGNTH